MMQCITSVTYSIKFNGKPQGHITPTRGLRQVDPLSPYLILLCAEGLSTLTKKSVSIGEMDGIAMCRRGPQVSHLFFADNSIIFYKATREKCEALQRVLKVYEQALGQQLNRAKNKIWCAGYKTT